MSDGWNRRDLLRHSLGLGAALGFGGLDLGVLLADDEPGEPWREGVKLGEVGFQAEPADPLGVPIADGLDERLYTDLSRVDAGRRITPAEEFFVRTGVPDGLDPSQPWLVRIYGRIQRPLVHPPANLESRAVAQGVHLIECAGNGRSTRFGLISTADWTGVSLADLLDDVTPLPGAAAVQVTGFDEHSAASTNSTGGCSWIFPRRQLESAGAFLATRMNGRPLSPEHGFPARLVVPGWYGCCCIKWVTGIKLVAAEEPATSQMREFASRTHQDGVPARAADYSPATVDRAAMPVRVEKWRLDGKVAYRVVGIDWGGDGTAARLHVRFSPRDPYRPVNVRADRSGGGWGVWEHRWQPVVPGRYLIQLKFDDPPVQARRLDAGLYLRGLAVDEV